MDRKQFAMVAAALQTYYPRENLLSTKQALELWFAQLQDIPYEVAEMALNRWVATEKWPPTIADIREQAANIAAGDLEDWGEGWRQVVSAIGVYGYCNPQEALDSMDEITRECVRRLGWMELCMSENATADRANFRAMYEALKERKKKERQTPEAIRLMIAGIQQKQQGRLTGE